MTDPLTREEVEARIADGALAPWKRRRYETFDRTMTESSPSYPCYFAVDAHEEGDLRYVFPEAPGSGASEAVGDALAAYLDGARDIAAVTSLVVLFEPPASERSAEWYKGEFWDLLEALHRSDPAPWPDAVPSDPRDPRWAFSFAGEPLFLVARAPIYERRRSRYTHHGLEVTVQPRWVFEGLGADTERGAEARRRIRKRLGDYDDLPTHPDVGAYGDPETREWQQYFLPETNAESLVRFPFSIEAE